METFIGIILGAALVWLASMVYAERKRAENAVARFYELRALYDEQERLYDEQVAILRQCSALTDELMAGRKTLQPLGPDYVAPYSLIRQN